MAGCCAVAFYTQFERMKEEKKALWVKMCKIKLYTDNMNVYLQHTKIYLIANIFFKV